MWRWCHSSGTWKCAAPCSEQNVAGALRVDETEERLRVLQELPIRTDTEPDLGTALDLARTRGLSFYDAMYLELARRSDVALATLDTALARAAVVDGLELIEPMNAAR